MTPESWIGTGTAFLLIGTVFGTAMVTWGTVQTMKIIVDSTTIIKTATTDIKTATTELQTQTEKIERLNTEIAETAAKISDFASESLNQLTSADSFCYVTAAVAVPNNDSVLLTLFHQGRYALSDVVVEVRDIAATERVWETFRQSGQTRPSSADMLAARGIVFFQNIGTVIPRSGRPLTSVPYANDDERRTFHVSIVARNGFYRETITIAKRKDGTGWDIDEHLFKKEADTEVQIWEHARPPEP